VIATALAGNARLVFLCSPSNPAGSAIALEQVERVATALQGRARVVVDEAYAEYAALPSAVTLLPRYDNVAVLRTLSKAHALAAARIGSLIAAPALIALLRRCQAPYPIPGPCAELALAGLSDSNLQLTASRVERIKAERGRLQQALAVLPGVLRVYPSQGNYLLVRFSDAQQAFDALLAAGVVVRDQRAAPQLHDALRITIGSTLENDRVLSALAARRVAA
jgi:histidinol-phosphate aminotransferase